MSGAHSRSRRRNTADALVRQVYDRLRRLATAYMLRERVDHSLEPAALVNEAYLRMIEIDRVAWRGKTHFFAVAARQMRRVLVEHARKRGASKRGGELRRITLDEQLPTAPDRTVDLIALHEALESLARRSERQALVAELRCFTGLGVREIAGAVSVSERTVREDWRVARAWLARELSGADADGSA